MDFNQTISYTSDWYLEYLNDNNNIKDLSINQILAFCELANNKRIKWALY